MSKKSNSKPVVKPAPMATKPAPAGKMPAGKKAPKPGKKPMGRDC